MATTRYDNFHSRLVFWLKILLPLGALVLLSTLFMVSSTLRPEDAIPYAKVDIGERIKEPRLTSPDFSGMTEDGAALSLKAAEARPASGENQGQITTLSGLLETPDGARTDLTAALARLDQVARVVFLEGGVTMFNSTGYRIDTTTARVSLDRTSLDADGGIKVQGPVGQISAESLHLGKSGSGTGGYVMVFKGGVRLIYLPGQQGTEN